MLYKSSISIDAQHDINIAYRYYIAINSSLALSFIDDLEHATNRKSEGLIGQKANMKMLKL